MTAQEAMLLEEGALSSVRDKKYSEAIKAYEQLLFDDPNWEHGYPYLNLAYCYEQVGNMGKARAAYLQALEKCEDELMALQQYASFLRDRTFLDELQRIEGLILLKKEP